MKITQQSPGSRPANSIVFGVLGDVSPDVPGIFPVDNRGQISETRIATRKRNLREKFFFREETLSYARAVYRFEDIRPERHFDAVEIGLVRALSEGQL